MRMLQTRVVWGVLLIAAGALFLLQNLGVVPQGLELFWALAFGLASVLFLLTFFSQAESWWAAIPGFALLGLAATLVTNRLATPGWGQWGGPLFLGFLALGFFAVFLRQPRHWWAILPGGFLLTTAVVAGLEDAGRGEWSASILFAGMGLTFAILAFLPGATRSRRWALFPAGALLLLALLNAGPGQRIANLAWPAILILLGGWLLLRRPRSQPPAVEKPSSPPESPSGPSVVGS